MSLFYQVHQITTNRKKIHANVKREIKAIKMFLPVVIVYFLTNVGPIANYVLIHFTTRAYREMYQLLFLSIALNPVANLPIYYWGSTIFRSEFQEVVGSLWSSKISMDLEMRDKKDKTTANTSMSSTSNMF